MSVLLVRASQVDKTPDWIPPCTGFSKCGPYMARELGRHLSQILESTPDLLNHKLGEITVSPGWTGDF